MRWGLLAVRLSVVAVYMIIAAIIVMSVLPLATGKLQVSIPEDGSGEPVMDGSKVTMIVPVDITNDGYFDIEDLTVRFKIADGGNVLTEQSSVPLDAVVGRVSHLNLTIVMNMDDIDEGKLKDLVFNATDLNLEVNVSAGYTLGLVRVSVGTVQVVNWDPMISNVGIDSDNLQWQANGTNMDLLVPYHFDASGFALGKSVSVNADISNSTAVLGTASQSLTINDSNTGTLRFVMPQATFFWLQAHPEALTLGADVSIMGATMHLDQTIDAGVIP